MDSNSPDCCGMSLRKGSIVVGSFEMLGFSIGLLSSLWSLWTLPSFAARLNLVEELEERGQLVTSDTDENEFGDVLTHSLTCLFFLMGLISAILLLVGVKLVKRSLCKVWMTVKIVSVVIAILHLIVSPGIVQPWAMGAYVLDAILVSFSVPSFAVVYSLVGEMTKKKEEAEQDQNLFKTLASPNQLFVV